MAYPSNEELCNLALAKIGEYTITDINASGRIESLCRRHLPQVRRELLRRHAWNFANARVELAISPVANAFGFEYRFALPTDYIQTLEVWADADMVCRIDKFDVEGKALLCDYEEAFLKYTSDVQNPEDWDTLFVKAVVLSLASELANNLGAEAKVTGLIQELEQVVLPDAMTSNAWEDRSGVNNPTQDRIQQSVWTNQYNYTI
jgi:hypothetical protein